MNPPPSGTVTFLFTDIEGSSRLWENHGDSMGVALARHDAILREAVGTRGGHIFKTIGDAFCVAFDVAANAVETAVVSQRALRAEPWEDVGMIKVRMGIHTGSAEARDDDYFGPVLNRVSRLLTAAHGGQVLLTLATEELVRDHLPEAVTLRDLGERRLRDLNRPERVFQVLAPDLPSEFPALRSLEIFPNNLPVQLTTFIGREKEMAEVKRLLGTTHLLTLTGTGGTGKTRLSMQVAADVLDQFPDGVWLVELATSDEAGEVAPAIAAPLQVREESGQPMLVTLVNYLRNKKAMLILDNCEHLVIECARVAEALLRACPGLQILASSREALAIAGERTWPVPSLSVPENWRDEIRGGDAAEKLTEYEAVRLFVDRATAVRPSFHVTNENAPFVAEICARLDGIPLAIELAAARIRLLSVDQIANRLDDQFRLLTGGSRTALPRQQTLRALIDWSHGLLSEQEKILLRRLSVFAGGRTLAAVEAVCADDQIQDFEIIDLLSSLVDKSLVSVERTPAMGTRYTFIESVWNYAREKLTVAGEAGVIYGKHLEYFLGIAIEAAPELTGPRQLEWIERLRPEFYNFRYALDASVEMPGLAQMGLRLATALGRFWEVRTLLSEAGEYFEKLLAHPDNAPRTAVRAAGLAAAGRVAWLYDRLEQGYGYANEALAIYRELGDLRGVASAALDVAFYEFDARRFDEARALLHEMAGLVPKLEDNKRMLAMLRRGEAIEALIEQDHARVLALQEDVLAIHRDLGDFWFIGISQWAVGITATFLRDFAKARASLLECLDGSWSVGNRWAVAYPLEGFAALAIAQGQHARGARLLGAAEALRAEFGTSTETTDHPTLRRILAQAAEHLAKPECLAARKEGRSLSADAAVKFAREEQAPA